jgi:hypothetical protein
MGLIILGMHGIIGTGVACKNRFIEVMERLLNNSEATATLLGSFHSDVIATKVVPETKLHIDLKPALTKTDNLARRSTHLRPFRLATGAVASPDNLRKRVPTTDSMQKPKYVPNVAFSTRIRTDHDGKLTNRQVGVSKVLEIAKPDF